MSERLPYVSRSQSMKNILDDEKDLKAVYVYCVVFCIFLENLVAFINLLFVLFFVDVVLLPRINQWAR